MHFEFYIRIILIKRVKLLYQIIRFTECPELCQVIYRKIIVIVRIGNENNITFQFKKVRQVGVTVGRDIIVVDDKQKFLSERRKQFKVFFIESFNVTADKCRIRQNIRNNIGYAVTIFIVIIISDMSILRSILLRISTDKLALADTGNACQKHLAFVLYQRV